MASQPSNPTPANANASTSEASSPSNIADKLPGAHAVSHAAHKTGQTLRSVGDEASHRVTNALGLDRQARRIHRYASFVPTTEHNDVKWYVDGCSYMWAVSMALERARDSIWILDWWLSPELYLRRPPSEREQYRLDRMLLAAAQRGVKIRIIVYKEVPEVLPLDSAYTKHTLEKLHPNIAVFRHPDHTFSARTFRSSLLSSLEHLHIHGAQVSKKTNDNTLQALYGMDHDAILYWAHHEKLCLIDGRIAFMGGLDLCYGRWDTHQHSIADVHPGDTTQTIWPGQDYNNARIADFSDVAHWQQNKLNRAQASRMGWSDISICVVGPVMLELEYHFVQRWNFIFDEKYNALHDRYTRLTPHAFAEETEIYPCEHHNSQTSSDPPRESSNGESKTGDVKQETHPSSTSHGDQGTTPQTLTSQESTTQEPTPNEASQKVTQEAPQEAPHEHRHHGGHLRRLARKEHELHGRWDTELDHWAMHHLHGETPRHGPGRIACQLVRSATVWSNGTATEHSVQNAYISVIRESQHFIYIENQFFITATGDQQKPFYNLIGAALVERIVRAAQNNQDYRVMVVMPAIPGFAGDLKSDVSIGTLAIMDYQYKSINRGGHSIMEELAQKGIDPHKYIRFFNLRNYDRINVPATPTATDNAVSSDTPTTDRVSNLDTVADCYMLHGRDIREVPWHGGPQAPGISAFVHEELYIHTKVLIADDRIVICGSANLNDRSQLGTHDSEIALVIEEADTVSGTMAGQPWNPTRFAASLRRFLFRKHLGLVPAQQYTQQEHSFEPVGSPQSYDFGSAEDALVSDPLSSRLWDLIEQRTATNTAVFEQVFHAIPTNQVRTWDDYKTYYEQYFHSADAQALGKTTHRASGSYKYGHVVESSFPVGDPGLQQVKDLLSTVRGNLVDMPLDFLKEEDLARTGIALNDITEPIYT